MDFTPDGFCVGTGSEDASSILFDLRAHGVCVAPFSPYVFVSLVREFPQSSDRAFLVLRGICVSLVVFLFVPLSCRRYP